MEPPSDTGIFVASSRRKGRCTSAPPRTRQCVPVTALASLDFSEKAPREVEFPARLHYHTRSVGRCSKVELGLVRQCHGDTYHTRSTPQPPSFSTIGAELVEKTQLIWLTMQHRYALSNIPVQSVGPTSGISWVHSSHAFCCCFSLRVLEKN
jgi:hypothetical protein